MLTKRQSAVLDAIVRQYITDAFPVSSEDIAAALPFRVSSATIRNDMADLEEGGYLAQPHVSAGRVPTLEAFRFSVQQHLRGLHAHEAAHRHRAHIDDPQRFVRTIARNTGVISYFCERDVPFFAGLESVFTAPELRNEDALEALAHIMEAAREWRERLVNALRTPLCVFIGEENPVFASEHFSIVAARLPDRRILALLGPVRMDYLRAIHALQRYVSYE